MSFNILRYSCSRKQLPLLAGIGLILCGYFLYTDQNIGLENRVKMANEAAKCNTAFCWDMYLKLSANSEDGGNVFYSPYSISTALAMTLVGARGKTATQMKNVLKFGDQADGDIHKNFEALQGVINAPDAPYSLNTANRIFTRKDYKILESFLKETNQHYKAEAVNLDFGGDAEGSRKQINDWVESQTANKIKELMAKDSITPDMIMVLVNAIYFKGNWEHKFDEARTKKEQFQVTDSENVEVNMMHLTREFRFSKRDDLDCQILRLPYVKEDVAMYIFLPNKVTGVAALEGKLTADHLHDIEKDFFKGKVVLSLPRFKVEQSFDLGDTLAALGMSDLFTAGAADLSGVDGSRELYVSKVVHKAFVEVNEEGTEAAAATAVGMVRMCLPMTHTFKVDHPFLFLIRDNRTGSVLFLGRVSRPSS